MSGEREIISGHRAQIGPGSTVVRLVPTRARRRIGAWCFLDHFGPVQAGTGGMSVGPHPHVGLQTASWLFEGEIHHVDSTGAQQVVRPGQLNLMTAGRGIAHSEDVGETPRGLHGVQLWIALPEAHRSIEPSFDHHPELPSAEGQGYQATVVIGEAFGLSSPARVYTPLLLAEVRLDGGSVRLPLPPGAEHGIAVVQGRAQAGGRVLEPGNLLYLPPGELWIELDATPGTRLMLLGGEPFGEPLIMGWNWVVRTNQELVQAHEAWARGEGHGDLSVFGDRPRIAAPPLRGPLVAR